MATIEPVGGGAGSGSSGSGSGATSKGRKTKTRKTGGRKAQKPRTPNVPGTSHAHVGATLGGEGKLPTTGRRVAIGAAETLELAPPFAGSALDALLDVVGAEHFTLRETLSGWQREQDRLINRAWRRPGGLARPAGL
ncbi:MAG TPA: hypothetical protein VMV29_06070 [Ktedonobacterales bacterium]|nr:hypothetical protein [Ktedonobacterales bacterium]